MRRLEALTPTELKVVELMADGHNRESLARRLDITANTVRAHTHHIYGKLGFNQAIEVVAWYHKEKCPQCSNARCC